MLAITGGSYFWKTLSSVKGALLDFGFWFAQTLLKDLALSFLLLLLVSKLVLIRADCKQVEMVIWCLLGSMIQLTTKERELMYLTLYLDFSSQQTRHRKIHHWKPWLPYQNYKNNSCKPFNYLKTIKKIIQSGGLGQSLKIVLCDLLPYATIDKGSYKEQF